MAYKSGLGVDEEEIRLCLVNNGRLYPMILAAVHGLENKKEAGKYDAEKAPRAFLPAIVAELKECNTGCATPWYNLLTPAQRINVARALLNSDGYTELARDMRLPGGVRHYIGHGVIAIYKVGHRVQYEYESGGWKENINR